MNVKEIVTEYLKVNGYDGLIGDECGCKLDDLFPCCDFGKDCEPGYACPIKPCTFPDEFQGACTVRNKDITKCPMEDQE